MQSPADGPSVSQRRRQVIRYVVVVLVISFGFQAWMIQRAGGLRALGNLSALILMWIPGVVSLIVRALDREGLRDVGWRAGPWLLWGFSYLAPAVCASFTYGAAWAVRAVALAPPPGATHWLVEVVVLATIGVFIANLTSLGEELGWRGYLLTRLVEAKLPAPLVLGGVIWGVWHLPLILWGDYATSGKPLVSAFLFMVCVTLAGVFFGWLRLASGSVWPAVIAHSSHNVFYQSVYDRNFEGSLEPYFAGEQGAFSIVAYGAIVMWLCRSGRLERVTREPVLFARPGGEVVVGASTMLVLALVLGCSGGQSAANTPPAPGRPTPTAVDAGAGAVELPLVRATAHGAELAKAGIQVAALPQIEALPKDSIRPVMEVMSRAVGLPCTGCHVSEQDLETETPNMAVARRMWNDFVVPHRLASGPIFCDSCHAGQARPLAGESRKTVTAYMKREYAGKLASTDGAAVGCVVCHGDPFQPHIIESLWQIAR